MPDEDDSSADVSFLASILCLKARVSALEFVVLRAVRQLSSQEQGVEMFLLLNRVYRQEIEETLISVEDNNPSLAAELQRILDDEMNPYGK